uniref:SFRICE_025425 n=1 Tax=Spodoptera frugiperda TaxID=7108 RepID=A0A2H1VK26_SPOFR
MLERYSRISLAGNSKITPPPAPVNDMGDADACTIQGINPPQLRMGAMVIYYACIVHINLPLESLYLLKKPHQNPLRSFKDVSVQRDIGTEKATLFYTM